MLCKSESEALECMFLVCVQCTQSRQADLAGGCGSAGRDGVSFLESSMYPPLPGQSFRFIITLNMNAEEEDIKTKNFSLENLNVAL